MNRRDFLKIGAASGVSLLAGGESLVASPQARRSRPAAAARVLADLYRPPVVSPEGLTLTTRQTMAEIAPDVRSLILTYGDGPVGPTIETRRGQRATITLRNELAEPTIAHWHGLRPPESADGHPRLAIGAGGTYEYDFVVDEPPGLYWYHSHAHARTGPQVYYGLAGLFIVRDEAEAALGLPVGAREVAVVLQDKLQDVSGQLVYGVAGHQVMEGFLGDAPFVNGTRFPRIEVDSALYRLRVLSAGNARIFRLGLSNERPLTLIGADGGLLDTPHELPFIDLGTGERADLLVDFSGLPVGTLVTLRSLEFADPGMRGMMGGAGGADRMRGMGMEPGAMGGPGGMRAMGGMPGMAPDRGMEVGGGRGMTMTGLAQGTAMDLLEFVVTREVEEEHTTPDALVPLPAADRTLASRERVFRFQSAMMVHGINGQPFDMERVDERVPFGATEVWRFVNEAPFPHPVHIHATRFRVLERHGGRAEVFPWERGWKDTVLVFPGEEVEVLATFDRHRGTYLLHCHNLEHEDAGMMMNFVIE